MSIKYLNITVTNKKATFLSRQGDIVCGNSDYRIRFTFDSEWDDHDAKVARFLWGGHFTDVEFSGNEVDVPVISGAFEVKVGVYIDGDGPHTTTSAIIPCTPSVLCEGGTASLENDGRYLNEAREVLEQCEAVQDELEQSATSEATPGTLAKRDTKAGFYVKEKVGKGSRDAVANNYAILVKQGFAYFNNFTVAGKEYTFKPYDDGAFGWTTNAGSGRYGVIRGIPTEAGEYWGIRVCNASAHTQAINFMNCIAWGSYTELSQILMNCNPNIDQATIRALNNGFAFNVPPHCSCFVFGRVYLQSSSGLPCCQICIF